MLEPPIDVVMALIGMVEEAGAGLVTGPADEATAVVAEGVGAGLVTDPAEEATVLVAEGVGAGLLTDTVEEATVLVALSLSVAVTWTVNVPGAA
jgi:hypothetical protein